MAKLDTDPYGKPAMVYLHEGKAAGEAFKKAQKEGMPEDESKDGEAQAQKLLEKFTKTLDEAKSVFH